MGNLSIKKNKSSEAITFFKQSLEMSVSDENRSESFYGISAAYFKSRNNSTARSYLLKALKISPNSGKFLLLLGD